MLLETALNNGKDTMYGFNIPHGPTISDVPKKGWWKRYWCRHLYVELYQEKLYFFQERVGTATHFACLGCGTTKVIEEEC